MRRVAFRSPNWLGDAVMATVILPGLRRAHPDDHLAVLAPSNLTDLFRGSPHVDQVVGFDRSEEVDAYRAGRYDRVLLGPTSFGSAWRAWRGRARKRFGFATAGRRFLLTGSLPGREYRRDRHQVENYRALGGTLGSPVPEDSPAVEIEAEWRERAAELWPGSGTRRVVVQPGATYGPAKRWPASRFAAVARKLLECGVSVAIAGGPGDREAVSETLQAAGDGVTDLLGKTSVGVLAAVLASADLVITNDTGPMHLAAATGTRTLAIFGSTSPGWTRPWGEGHRVLQHRVPCQPCFQRTCRIGYLCLEGIEEERVVTVATSMLKEKRT